jgi:hypothetical protein
VQYLITLHSWSASRNVNMTLFTALINLHPGSAPVWSSSVSDVISRSSGACSAETCYIKAQVIPLNPVVDIALTTYPSYTFLSTMINAKLDSNPSFTVENFVLEGNQMHFSLRSDVTAPFMFLELANQEKTDLSATTKGVYTHYYAGWFSDNNFVAEANVEYALTYTFAASSAEPSASDAMLTVSQFQSLMKIRSLQSVYEC